MRGPSHMLVGLGTALAVQQVHPFLPLREPAGLFIAVGATLLGALLPDVDSAGSTIHQITGTGPRPDWTSRRVLRLLGRRRRTLFTLLLGGLLTAFFALITLIMRLVVHVLAGKHRGRTHSLVALALVLAGAAYLGWPAWAIALGAGYASHLLADSLTRSGIPLAWPIGEWRFHLLPRGLRLTTGTWPEVVIVLGVVAWMAYTVLNDAGLLAAFARG